MEYLKIINLLHTTLDIMSTLSTRNWMKFHDQS